MLRIEKSIYFLVLIFLTACGSIQKASYTGEKETRIKNVKKITDSGKNAEAYFSADGRWLIYQSHNENTKCDQMYVTKTNGEEKRLVSTGKGRVTCGYFVDPGSAEQSRIIYSSTHDFSPNCPPEPDRRKGYVWPVYSSYEIYIDHFKGGVLKRLTENNAYDAEATVSPDGKKIVFTSTRDGDLDIYTMNVDGTNVKRLTNTLGYDGGAFFTPDGKSIVYRSYHPKTDKEKKKYVKLLKEGFFRPSTLEVFVMNLEEGKPRKITDLGSSTFAPFMHKNKSIIFSSNYPYPRGRAFHLFQLDEASNKLEKITELGHFNSFPMFSQDGRKIVWASDRHSAKKHEINIFIGDWVEVE